MKKKGKAKPSTDKKAEVEKHIPAANEAQTAVDSENTTLVGDNDSIQDGGESTTNQPSPQDAESPPRPSHNRQPSLSIQSKIRSTSFRQNSISQTSASNLPPLSPDADSVTEVYRKQAARLEELEKENKRLAKEARESEGRWRKMEEELEDLREANGEVAELKSKAATADAKAEEVNKLVRLAHAMVIYRYIELILNLTDARQTKSPLSTAKYRLSSPIPRDPAKYHRHNFQEHPPPTPSPLNSPPNLPLSNPWS